jgi:hypothetical protein
MMPKGTPTPAPTAILTLDVARLLDETALEGFDISEVDEDAVEDEEIVDVVEVEMSVADVDDDVDEVVSAATPMIVRVVGEPGGRVSFMGNVMI